MLKQAWMMKNVKPVYRDDSALKIGMEYHQNLEKLIADLSTMDAIVLPSGVSITTLGDRVLVSMSSPGGPVSGMPSSIDGIPLRGSQCFIEYTALAARVHHQYAI